MAERPTDDQLREWLNDIDAFPNYWEDTHDEYLESMCRELLECRSLLADLVDDENPCRFDHDGDCQEHSGMTDDGECSNEAMKRLTREGP